MDKETFLRQLETAVVNNNKESFIDTIYSLTSDLMLDFTEEEISQIMRLASKNNLHDVDDLYDFLEKKGSFFLENGSRGGDELINFSISMFYNNLLISLSGNNKQKFKFALLNNAFIHHQIAEVGIDSEKNLETAVRLYFNYRKMFPEINEDYVMVLSNESDARQTLAKMGIDSEKNLETVVRLHIDAQKMFTEKSENYAKALEKEGVARAELAEMGIDSKNNLETAILLHETSKKILSKASADYAIVLVNEGFARTRLAKMGIDCKKNLEIAIYLYKTAQDIFQKTSAEYEYAIALINEGSARRQLAGIGIDSKKNLEIAIRLHVDAQDILPKVSEDYAMAISNEGIARHTLAEMGIDSKKNLETAVHLYEIAKEILPKRSSDYASTLMNEGDSRKTLAEMGIDSKKNLETAVCLHVDAQRIFHKTSTDYARALSNEGNARLRLAEMGIDSETNLEIAIHLYIDAQRIFPGTSVEYAKALMNEGSARQILADMNIEYSKNHERSKKLYLESISILEKLGDGWIYSIALLNFSGLLLGNFYKTGEKKYIEEWERKLIDIEEKIIKRDIRSKELLLARIHEISADLLGLEGNYGIIKASREYEKAYKLSKDPFYNFMDEFCQARISVPLHFCELFKKWENSEKAGIFLDYYDYTAFECHLEEALKYTKEKKPIDGKKALTYAIKKLKEIQSRTYIKIMKCKVSAYIHLLHALKDCFTECLYEEASKKIEISYKIFEIYKDETGQKICNKFSYAIENEKNDPNVWLDIISSGEISSNFYNLLCEYSKRKRASIDSNISSQISEDVKEVRKDVKEVRKDTKCVKEKVDQLQVFLNQRFAEIKGQIREGFKGTYDQLYQINGKINNIETDFEYLVQISDEVDSKKEGTSLREFVTNMTELMEHGDQKALDTLNEFSIEVVKSKNSLFDTIEKSGITEQEKVEGKSKLNNFSLKNIQYNLTESLISFGGKVTEEILVSLTAEVILKSLMPVLLMAIPGVPIASLITNLLLEVKRK